MVDNPRESAVVRRTLQFLNTLAGCFAFKTHGGAMSSGLPDIIACYHGTMLALEAKQKGKEASLQQQSILRKLHAAGAITLIFDDLEQVKTIIDTIDRSLVW